MIENDANRQPQIKPEPEYFEMWIKIKIKLAWKVSHSLDLQIGMASLPQSRAKVKPVSQMNVYNEMEVGSNWNFK